MLAIGPGDEGATERFQCPPPYFNTVFRELVTLVKTRTTDKAVRDAVKGAYRRWEPASPAIARAFHAEYVDSYSQVIEAGVGGTQGTAKLMAGLTHGQVAASMEPEAVPRFDALVSVLFALSMIQATHGADPAVLADIDPDLAAFADAAMRVMREQGGVR